MAEGIDCFERLHYTICYIIYLGGMGVNRMVLSPVAVQAFWVVLGFSLDSFGHFWTKQGFPIKLLGNVVSSML